MNAPEATPVENGVDVVDIIAKDLGRLHAIDGQKAIYPMIDPYDYLLWLAAKVNQASYVAVQVDIEKQSRAKEEKYGRRLKTFNGRNTLVDLYADLLELITHVGKARLEGKL